MTRQAQYRQWHLFLRTDEQTCVVVSPYGVPTAAATRATTDTAVAEAKDIVDRLIEEHYPETGWGRYLPPLQYRPKPGQPRGWLCTAGGQRLPDSLAEAACQAGGWEMPT